MRREGKLPGLLQIKQKMKAASQRIKNSTSQIYKKGKKQKEYSMQNVDQVLNSRENIHELSVTTNHLKTQSNLIRKFNNIYFKHDIKNIFIGSVLCCVKAIQFDIIPFIIVCLLHAFEVKIIKSSLRPRSISLVLMFSSKCSIDSDLIFWPLIHLN